MSIVIALIGIVNTLTLSIFERRRELGLLRAVGMTPKEVRHMVGFESVQVALLGTVVGMVSGGVMGWLLIRASEFSEVTLDTSRLAIIFALGIAIGMVAANRAHRSRQSSRRTRFTRCQLAARGRLLEILNGLSRTDVAERNPHERREVSIDGGDRRVDRVADEDVA